MTVLIPENHLEERQYIVGLLLNDFLGLNIKIESHKKNHYSFQNSQGELIIKDAFFSQHQAKSYLDKKNIPSEISYYKGAFAFKEDLPVIYGNPQITQSEQKIECEIDLFASSFFMLTRWEEWVSDSKDEYERFKEENNLAIQQGFEKRAIVNEYTELLWNMLQTIAPQLQRKTRKYQAVITHDIDYFRRYDSLKKLLKALGGDILKRRDIKRAFHSLGSFIKYQTTGQGDPYDQFSYLMDISEKQGLKSHFYFMPTFTNEKDARYNIKAPLVQKCIRYIQKRNHIVGIHASYYSFKNKNLFKTELARLNTPSTPIKEGRQHYLRFEIPTTWAIWEENNLEKDNSLGFYHRGGFRCGCCYSFPVFNIETKQKLKLKEQPLIAMEGALVKEFPKPIDFVDGIVQLSEEVRLYEGEMVLLWHNHNFDIQEWKDYSLYYEYIIEKIS